MSKSLNTPIQYTRKLKLIYEFKRYHNFKHKTKLPPLDGKLHGCDFDFKKWLSLEKGITDLDLYLKSLEVNTSLKGEYHGKGTRIYSKL
tara:strand:- start:137 stop:403 length:267 start_codon:yes stop_codon:yes gene_type:complete